MIERNGGQGELEKRRETETKIMKEIGRDRERETVP